MPSLNIVSLRLEQTVQLPFGKVSDCQISKMSIHLRCLKIEELTPIQRSFSLSNTALCLRSLNKPSNMASQ